MLSNDCSYPIRRNQCRFYTIQNQRQDILLLLKDNPSLKPYLPEAITIGYEKGLYLFGSETGLDHRQLPQSCPFSAEQIFEEPINFPESPANRTS